MHDAAHPTARAAAARPTVLVAEDNPVNQRVAVKMLERLGCRVDLVADGTEAVSRVASTAYDLVLMDCQMPTMDGYEATERIRRADHDRTRVPIVAMTAHALQGDRARCLAAGMDDYISKPVQPADLKAIVERFVRLSRDRSANGGTAAADAAPRGRDEFSAGSRMAEGPAAHHA
jgi:CheY-like chemotaxis protein